MKTIPYGDYSIMHWSIYWELSSSLLALAFENLYSFIPSDKYTDRIQHSPHICLLSCIAKKLCKATLRGIARRVIQQFYLF